MNKFFENIKNESSFRYRFFNVLLLISTVMIVSAFFCLCIYIRNYSYDLLLSAKELLLGAFGVFVINCSVFYVLSDINTKLGK